MNERLVFVKNPVFEFMNGGQIVKYLFFTFREFLILPCALRIPPCVQRPVFPVTDRYLLLRERAGVYDIFIYTRYNYS